MTTRRVDIRKYMTNLNKSNHKIISPKTNHYCYYSNDSVHSPFHLLLSTQQKPYSSYSLNIRIMKSVSHLLKIHCFNADFEHFFSLRFFFLLAAQLLPFCFVFVPTSLFFLSSIRSEKKKRFIHRLYRSRKQKIGYILPLVDFLEIICMDFACFHRIQAIQVKSTKNMYIRLRQKKEKSMPFF